MTKDLAIAAFDRYEYEQLQYWVNSLQMSGFTGDIVLIIFNGSFETVQKLVNKGVQVVALGVDQAKQRYVHQSNMPVHTERFFHIYNYLSEHGYKYNRVITTDVKDVIFQQDPFKWLDKYQDKPIVVGSECMYYKDEPWGDLNLKQAFGDFFYQRFKNNIIYNVGVILGNVFYVRDLCLQIFQMCLNRPIPIVDQAVFNFLLATRPYQDCVQFCQLSDALVCHLGTTSDPTKPEFLFSLTEKPPIFEDGLFKTHDGKIFVSAHQWDRTNYYSEIMEKYRG